jgi:hypothetical protein
MSGIVAGYSDLSLQHVGNVYSEYLVFRTVQGIPRGFLIEFVNTGGRWQIDSM